MRKNWISWYDEKRKIKERNVPQDILISMKKAVMDVINNPKIKLTEEDKNTIICSRNMFTTKPFEIYISILNEGTHESPKYRYVLKSKTAPTHYYITRRSIKYVEKIPTAIEDMFSNEFDNFIDEYK